MNIFVEAILKEKPDIIALQEVNQSADADFYPSIFLQNFTRCKNCDVVVRMDNHAARLANLLQEKGLVYYWTWIPVKLGYSIYDEGLAIFSNKPILNTEQFPISKIQDYSNWKSRKALGIKTAHEGGSWFYTVHMGWWNDEEELFKNQWDRILEHIKKGEHADELTFMMGDFNSPAEVREEGYDYVKHSGWLDTWNMAKQKDSGVTVEKKIDGWKECKSEGMRIDQVWVNQEICVERSSVVFNGINYPVVSDHYGVQVEIATERDKKDE